MAEIIFADQAEEEIAKKLDPAFFRKASNRINEELEYQLARTVFNEYVTGSTEVSPEEAFTILTKARLWVETCITSRMVMGYSPLRWLWMMRRIPHHVFATGLPTTFLYDQALAETLSGIKRLEECESGVQIRKNGTIAYSILGATIRRLAEFCAAVRYLSSLHSALRWAGKGSRFIFNRNSSPERVRNGELEQAVNLYDQRLSGMPFQRFGTILGTVSEAVQEKSILYLHRVEPKLITIPIDWIPDNLPRTKKADELSVLCRYYPRPVSLEPFVRLLAMTNRATLWPRQAMILILLLWGAWSMIINHRAGRLSVITRGYLLLDDELIQQFYEPILNHYSSRLGDLFYGSSPPSSAVDFLTELTSIEGSLWPLRVAPLVRREGKLVCIDLVAASECLDATLESPIADGIIPNIRGQHFELVSQDLINQSLWKPTRETLDLRGRTLRIDGVSVTDIDALGECGDELLAVSCKAAIYSGEYDAGDYRTVRNAASVIVDSVKHWQDKMALIRSRPRGDNYDFTRFSRIIPVVCTPAKVYVPVGPATADVARGLRAASSVGELAAWLGLS